MLGSYIKEYHINITFAAFFFFGYFSKFHIILYYESVFHFFPFHNHMVNTRKYQIDSMNKKVPEI